ncbi:MAG: enoyl-CoA hydratase [Hyphomicrobium sp.]|nr:MAG: enoyl-CoA hydratase [Hyphomicrobium sp.]PPC99109.1 MAG: enoyl-CoA hydratase [Hyphomicrobium sp.]
MASPEPPSETASATTSIDLAKVELRRRGALLQIDLNRPKALNAFDDEMRRAIADEIPRIARNPDIYITAITSSSPKAFCAGGDVRALTREAREDFNRVKNYFQGEYSLNWLLDCFSKPTVSFINGICMGSGAGLSCYNTHRIAGENYKFAMPETAIGLFPDVGVAHVLAKLPWPIGLYLGLTGRIIERADAFWLGLATHCINGDAYEGILEKLADAQPVDPMLDGLHQDQGAGPLQGEQTMIEDLFSAGSLVEIVNNLQQASGASSPFAAKTLSDLRMKSPISLAITDRHIRECRNLDLRQTLIQDYRLAVRCLEASDFYEGVRAILIDKDGKPSWQPSSLDQVMSEMVDAYFAPLGNDDLKLPSRTEMQAARV